MTLETVTIADGADDSFEDAAGTNYPTATSGRANSANQWLGFRFPGVTIPDGAAINSAKISVYVRHQSMDEPDHNIYGENAGAPAQFAGSANNISGRPTTAATVNWSSGNLGGTGWHDTPDLTAIIEALMASYSYAAGRAMVFLFQQAGYGDLGVYFYEQSSSYGAVLAIDYTESSGGLSIPVAMRSYRNLRG